MKNILLSLIAVTGLTGGLIAGEATVYTADKTTYAPEPAGGPYIAIFGGANVHQSGDVDGDDDLFDADLDSDTGWFAGLKLGYCFPSDSTVKFALEVEGFYNGVENGIDVDSDLGNFNISTDTHAAVGMFNALVKFDLGVVTPYIGAGAGYAHVWVDDVEVNGINTNVSDDEGTFAYQGVAGLGFDVTDSVGLFIEYKALVYHDVHDVDNYLNHLVGAGVRFGF